MMLSKKQRISLHVLYWLLAGLFLVMFFWPTHEFPDLALFLVAIILPQTISVTYAINYILIPRLLFRKAYFLFGYTLLGTVVFSVWINILSLALLLIWADMSIVPTVRDFAVLLAGNYIIIFFAVIIHLVFSSFKDQLEKERLAKQQLETELKLNQAQNELLKSQIHPHFLFNTLNNLYGLCLSGSEKTCDTILKISELLDHMLYKCDKEIVSLESEIKFIENYLALEEIRADKRLSVFFEVKNKSESAFVPPLLLFPFIENAFKHSAKYNTGARTIKIFLMAEKQELLLTVNNNFVDQEDSLKKSGGLGLQNVQKRLDTIFGNDYNLKINKEGNEFDVSLSIPITRTS